MHRIGSFMLDVWVLTLEGSLMSHCYTISARNEELPQICTPVYFSAPSQLSGYFRNTSSKIFPITPPLSMGRFEALSFSYQCRRF